MRQLIRVSVVTVLCGCASYPPERVERDQLILAAVQPCKERYAHQLYNANLMSVNQDGVVRYWVRDTRAGDVDDINACLAEAQKGLKFGPFLPGKLVKAGPASVSITVADKQTLVPVRVNGIPGTMALSTRSELTSMTAAYAARAGVRLVAESPSARVATGGKVIVAPYARASSLEVGDASVERLDIAVYQQLPDHPAADGVLGNSFLSHFKMSIDRRNNRLTLEPIK